VFVLEHHFTSKSFGAVSEAFSNAYPDKAVPNGLQYTGWQQNFGTQQVFVCGEGDRIAEITVKPISGSASPLRTGHGCRNSALGFNIGLTALCVKVAVCSS
jgi:hypothetical protein